MEDDAAKKALAQGDIMVKIGGWIFILAGLGIMYGGYALWESEPNAWIMFPFGGVFAGMGVIIQRVFRVPEGKKRVVVQATSHSSGRRSHSSISSIYVDEDADESEIEAAKDRWAARQIAHREDWVEGRIRSDYDGDPSGRWKAAGVVAAIAACFALAGVLWEEVMIAFAWIAAIIAAILAYRAWWAAQHRAKYGESWLVPEELPFILGKRMEALIETGIPGDAVIPEAAEQTLTCVRTWKESYRGSDGKTETRTRSEDLWEEKRRRDALRRSDGVAIPVDFQIPEGLPPSTPASETGIKWRLRVRIDFKGLDYQSAFVVPVFEEGSLLADAMEEVQDGAEVDTTLQSSVRTIRS